MASKPVIIRLQTTQGTKRLTFQKGMRATFSDLQQEIQKQFKVPPDQQVLSYQRLHDPDFLPGNLRGFEDFRELKLSHGMMLYMVISEEHRKVISTEAKANSPPPKRKTGMRLADLPALKPEEKAPKHIAFHDWIQERQRKYEKQPWNIDPPKQSYNHVPTGKGVNFKDLPPNAVINQQNYRHCDVLQIADPTPFNLFKGRWDRDQNLKQRAALMFGRYEMGPHTNDETKKFQYAKVYALYEPPQENLSQGVTINRDRNERQVRQIAEACGLEPVGWVITTLPREDQKKYKGKVFVSSKEIVQASKFQTAFSNPNTGFSRFMTLVMEINGAAEAYQVSEQCIALVRDKLIKASDDIGFMQVNCAPKGAYYPAVIVENKEIRPGETFLPDALLITGVMTTGKTPEKMFQHSFFPQQGSKENLKQLLRRNKAQEYHYALSDWNLLINLPQWIGLSATLKVAQAVSSKTRLDPSTKQSLDSAFSAFRR